MQYTNVIIVDLISIVTIALLIEGINITTEKVRRITKSIFAEEEL